jgi:hypothetical protein
LPWYPAADRRNIPPGTNDPPINPRIAILHVDAGNAETLYHYFNGPSGGVESHFFVKKDGTVEQYRDTDYQADANLEANDYAVSIETQGFGSGEWTDDQLAAIKKLLVWINHVHPAVRLQKCSGPAGTGVGYHVQFGAPGPWAPVAKSCPGPDRVKQYNQVIVPWLDAGANLEKDEMTSEDREFIRDQADRVITAVRTAEGNTRDRLLAAIAALPTGSGGEVQLADVEAALRNVFADAATK